ncbi:MAG: NAD(P)-dependent oxidoreductase [Anaerolineae bacterium]|nr:NAD(P)-dependent oxidoreductase [Anaerolineae bacterium]
MRVLITGASGRFAEYMVRELRGRHDLVLFSRRPPPADRADLPCIRGDLTAFDDCRRAVEGIEAIMHLGAQPWPTDHRAEIAHLQARGISAPPFDATIRSNILGTYYLMMAAVEAGVRIVVMTGSNCAFGHGYRISDRPFPFHYLPLDEQHPSDVEDSYSYSKLAGEELLASFSRAYGIRTYVTRPAGICPPERLRRMAETAAPVQGWSEWLWGYVASEDLAALQRLILEKAEQLPVHDVYVANGLDTTLLEPTLEVIERFRPDLLPLARGLDGHQAFFSTARARAALGWLPARTWRAFLRQ